MKLALFNVITIQADADVNAKQAPDKTDHVRGHKTDMFPNPPTNRTEDGYAQQKNDLLHFSQ